MITMKNLNLFMLTLMVLPSSSLSKGSNTEVAGQQEKQHDFEACSFDSTMRFKTLKRSYKFQDDIYNIFNEQNCPNVTAPVSQISKCITSFELDPKNVIQHLQSTIDLLNDFYVFKNIAVNPLASDHLTTPFNYTIYNGTDQGQVDVISGLEGILKDVKSTNHATLDVFLQMNAVVSGLFDGHFSVNKDITTGGMLSNNTILFFSGEVLDGSAKGTKLRVKFPSEEFVLMADITAANDDNSASAVTSKKIEKIDGKDPLDFFIAMATKPNGLLRYKSLGARVQGMLKLFTAQANDIAGSFHKFVVKEYHPDQSKFWKDQYNVIYEDGSSTTWNLVQFVPRAVSCDMTKSQIETLLLTKPGKMYKHLESMKRAINGSEEIIQLQKKKQKSEDKRKSTQNDNDALLLPATERMSKPHSVVTKKHKKYVSFDMTYKSLGYKVFDDYAVLKLDSFSGEINEDKLTACWRDLTNEAHSKNVTKLIIDVVLNGGGFVAYGFFLANLLYPKASFEDFSHPYDRHFTPSIEDNIADIQGIMDSYYDLLQNDFHTVEQITDTLNGDTELLIKKIDSILNLLEAMMDILSSGKLKEKEYTSIYLKGSVLSAIESAKRFRESIIWELTEGNTNSASKKALEAKHLHKLWHIFVTVANNVLNYPFQDLNFKTMFGSKMSMTIASGKVEHVRGGIRANYTDVFYISNPKTYVETKLLEEKYIDYPLQFDEYIILGSGNSCGSTTSQFKHAMQVYAYEQNSESIVVPPVHTVSFGGTGKQQDAAVTQFPAGVAGEGGNVEELYLIGLILQVMNTLLPPMKDVPSFSLSWDLFDKFYNALPDACYFCNKAFSMSIYEVYSKLTGSEGIPLEYVNDLPDYYLRQWPMSTSFADDKDLPTLYKLTNRFFQTKTSG